MKILEQQELCRENGQNGAKTLVAVDGKVYDVSSSKKWRNGTHMNRHKAGSDLTAEISGAPHGPEVLQRFEQVGTYTARPPGDQSRLRAAVERWLERNPFFRRHPHPALVHFPLGLLLVVPVFLVLGLFLKSSCTEWAAYCCLIAAAVTMPAVIVSGYFTWWINFDLADFPTVRKKRLLAYAAAVLALSAIAVRTFLIEDPLRIGDYPVAVYIVICFLIAVVVGLAGFLGGSLTFPYEHCRKRD